MIASTHDDNDESPVVSGRSRVALLGLARKRSVAQQEHGQNHVGLLDHLFAIDAERMVEQQQRIALRRSVAEVPGLSVQKAVILRNDLRNSSYGTHMLSAARLHASGSAGSSAVFAPVRCMCPGLLPAALRPPGSRSAGSARHQVRVSVVANDRVVFIRPGHAVDAEPSLWRPRRSRGRSIGARLHQHFAPQSRRNGSSPVACTYLRSAYICPR